MQNALTPSSPTFGLDTQPPPRALIRLHAIDPVRNVARGYEINVVPDLFGHWIISLHWGRIGTKGQSRFLSFAEKHAAFSFIRHTLRRRASARKRIGVAYQRIG